MSFWYSRRCLPVLSFSVEQCINPSLGKKQQAALWHLAVIHQTCNKTLGSCIKPAPFFTEVTQGNTKCTIYTPPAGLQAHKGSTSSARPGTQMLWIRHLSARNVTAQRADLSHVHKCFTLHQQTMPGWLTDVGVCRRRCLRSTASPSQTTPNSLYYFTTHRVMPLRFSSLSRPSMLFLISALPWTLTEDKYFFPLQKSKHTREKITRKKLSLILFNTFLIVF